MSYFVEMNIKPLLLFLLPFFLVPAINIFISKKYFNKKTLFTYFIAGIFFMLYLSILNYTSEDPNRCGSPLVELFVVALLEMLALPIQFLANEIFLKDKDDCL